MKDISNRIVVQIVMEYHSSANPYTWRLRMGSRRYRIGTAARSANVCVETLRGYADKGLVEFEWVDNQRVFNDESIEQARQVKERNQKRLVRDETE